MKIPSAVFLLINDLLSNRGSQFGIAKASVRRNELALLRDHVERLGRVKETKRSHSRANRSDKTRL